jgi:hypothetical protein
MRKRFTILPIAALCVAVNTSFGQGTVTFSTRIAGIVDAPVTRPECGSRREREGTIVSCAERCAIPLFPITSFRTDFPLAEFYVHSIIVDVPGVTPGGPEPFACGLRQGADWDAAVLRGESNDITIIVGGTGSVNLEGLRFHPSTTICTVRCRAQTEYLCFQDIRPRSAEDRNSSFGRSSRMEKHIYQQRLEWNGRVFGSIVNRIVFIERCRSSSAFPQGFSAVSTRVARLLSGAGVLVVS